MGDKVFKFLCKIVYFAVLILLFGIEIVSIRKSDFSIDGNHVLLLSILIVYVLAPFFDNLSVVNLFTISRDIKNIKSDNEDIKREQKNIEQDIRMLSVNMSNFQNQKMNGNFYNIPQYYMQTSTEKEFEAEKTAKYSEDFKLEAEQKKNTVMSTKKSSAKSNDDNVQSSPKKDYMLPVRQIYYQTYIDLLALTKGLKNFNKEDIKYNVKFDGKFGPRNYDAVVKTGHDADYYKIAFLIDESDYETLILNLNLAVWGLHVYAPEGDEHSKLIVIIPVLDDALYKKLNFQKLTSSDILKDDDLKLAFNTGKMVFQKVSISDSELKEYMDSKKKN